MHLQDEDEVVSRLVAGVQEVAGTVLVVLIESELLDDIRVLEQPQQDLLRHQRRAELGDLCRDRGCSLIARPAHSVRTPGEGVLDSGLVRLEWAHRWA